MILFFNFFLQPRDKATTLRVKTIEFFLEEFTWKKNSQKIEIFLFLTTRLTREPNVRSIEYRSMKNFDEPAFLSSLSDIPLDTAHTFDDVNDIWCHWESLIARFYLV